MPCSNTFTLGISGLDEGCSHAKECYVSDNDVKNQQVACTSGRCQCIMGFHMALDHKTCTGSTTTR
jgi:hypothetical protein